MRVQVAPDLLDKGKTFNLTSAVFRKYCPLHVQGPPKAKKNVEGSVFKFNVPEIGWVDYSQEASTRTRAQICTHPCSAGQSSGKGDVAAKESPSSSSVWRQPHRTVQVHADTAHVRFPLRVSETLWQSWMVGHLCSVLAILTSLSLSRARRVV